MKNAVVSSGSQLLTQAVFRSSGYRREVRRMGELHLGYWRKTLKLKDQRSPYPKRFVLIPGFKDAPLAGYLVTRLLSPLFQKRFDEVIVFDFPNFELQSSSEKSFPSLELMTRVVNDTLDSLKPHTLAGYSTGGRLIAQYASLCGSGDRPLINRKNYSGPNSVWVV